MLSYGKKTHRDTQRRCNELRSSLGWALLDGYSASPRIMVVSSTASGGGPLFVCEKATSPDPSDTVEDRSPEASSRLLGIIHVRE